MMQNKLARSLLAWVIPVAILVLWWFGSVGSTSAYYPPLSKIFETFREEWIFDHVISDLWPSVYRILAGSAWAIALGVGLGLVVGLSKGVRSTVDPVLEFLRAIPAAAILPVSIIVLGVTDMQKIAFIVFGAFWPILLNTIEGVRGVDESVHEMARIYKFGRVRELFVVTIPAALPQVLAGIRIALAVAVLLVVYAEMFASTNGVGYFTLNAQTLFEIPAMWSGIFVLAILSYAVNGLFVLIEHRQLRWYRGWKASQIDG